VIASTVGDAVFTLALVASFTLVAVLVWAVRVNFSDGGPSSDLDLARNLDAIRCPGCGSLLLRGVGYHHCPMASYPPPLPRQSPVYTVQVNVVDGRPSSDQQAPVYTGQASYERETVPRRPIPPPHRPLGPGR